MEKFRNPILSVKEKETKQNFQKFTSSSFLQNVMNTIEI